MLSSKANAMNQLPAQSRLNDLFTYDGVSLRWKIARGSVKPGSLAGTLHRTGYIRVKVDGVQYGVHRVIWKLQTGDDPVATMDHKDGDRSNNRWDNLRLASLQEQQANIKGVKGVYKRQYPKARPWQAWFRGKALGCYESEELARTAYINAYTAHAGDWARTDRLLPVPARGSS